MPAGQQDAHWLVVDLEATCDAHGRLSAAAMEIIDFGGILLSPGNDVLDEFQCHVRPTGPVTPFCTELTGITRADVACAPDFPVVAGAIRQWLDAWRLPDLVWASWGDYDRRQLALDCARHGQEPPINAPHVNLRKRYCSLHAQPGANLEQALATLGLRFEGHPHRALDDARNTARLLQHDPALREKREPA